MYRLKRWVRGKTGPIKREVAENWKLNFSMLYALIAWNLLGFTMYFFLKDNLPKKKYTNSDDYIKLLGIKDTNVVKLSGLKIVDQSESHYTQEELDKFYEETKKQNKS